MMTKQRLAQTRAGLCDPGTGEPEQMASAAEGTLGRGTRRAATSTDYMEDQSPDDAGRTTGRRSKRAGRDEGGNRTLRRSAGGCTKRSGAAGTRDHVEDG